MKQKIISILLLLFIFLIPISAQDTPYTLRVNGIPYMNSSPLIEHRNQLYISSDDLSHILMTPITYSDSTYKFTINNQKIELKSGTSSYSSNSQNKAFSVPTLVINGLFYVPCELFSQLGYPYTITASDKVLSIKTPVPYSRNADDPLTHSFKPAKANLENIPEHVLQLSHVPSFEKIIDHAIRNKLYISFLDNSSFENVYKVFGDKFKSSPYNNISIILREIDTSVYPNVIKNTVTLPVSVQMTPDFFNIAIDDISFEYKKLWSTFYPAHSLTDVDLHKSVDATLMRVFYTYYRDRYDFRDDTYFVPHMELSSDRTTTMSHGAYTLSHDEQKTDYRIHIYRVHPSGSMNYIIDLEVIQP